ncbi:Crp/Fnr family transcriptional regulator [Bauldia sp.]|uniref:Crp/Fnr family transcriptional regulator n=1 Tax=Bauldia sp. TaxID=2575872 RepID=UPI003BA84D7C
MSSLLGACNDLEPQRLAVGEALFREGEYSGAIYVLLEGELEVRKGDVAIASVATPGAFFGEMSVLTGGPHSATVLAATESKVYVRNDARELLVSRPELLLPIAQVLARRLATATDRLADLKSASTPTGPESLEELYGSLIGYDDRFYFSDAG